MKQYTLPADFARKWVDALRSGEYKQIKGDLYYPENEKKQECFCANGVGLLLWGIPRKELIFHSFVDQDLYNKYPTIPTDLVEIKTKYESRNLFDEIAKLNDLSQLTFPVIADWIEQNVEFVEDVAMIQLINPINLIGDLMGTLPVMCDLAEKNDGLRVYQTLDEGKWIYPLIPKKYNIELVEAINTADKVVELDINEAFKYGVNHNLYMSQCYHNQFGLATPNNPRRPYIEVPDIDVPVYDYILAPFSRSTPENQKWDYLNWYYFYLELRSRDFKVCFLGNSKHDHKIHGTNCEFDRPLPEVLAMLKKCRRGCVSINTGISHLCYAVGTKNYLLNNQGKGWGVNPDAISIQTYIPRIKVAEMLEFVKNN